MAKHTEPVYLQTHRNGELAEKIDRAGAILSDCTLCPRQCRVDRLSGNTGTCGAGRHARVASFHAHFGEESPLVGTNGSGTIFFAHCNLLCPFCQNYDISHEGAGQDVNADTLAGAMLALQKQGCHNINLVTPSHVVPQILAAVEIAAASGLHIPLVYNSGGYDRVETVKLLDGVIDIYMPDFKFWDPAAAEKTCNAADYPERARRAITEMHRQVGDLIIDADGLARRGLIVRHLVLPGDLAGTGQVMRFIAGQISKNTYVNVMSQYRPCGAVSEIAELNTALSPAEYRAAVKAAKSEGITRFDQR
ncbi:MAG: radical SAM protein [Thermodesulfobacteriota bacterium]